MRVTLALLLLAALPLAGQKKAWVQPRTPDGQPDMQGVWTNATLTPFERPARFGNRATMTAAEAAEIEQRAAAARADDKFTPGEVGSYNQAFFDSGTTVAATLQTSLVTEPADGRVPLSKKALEMWTYDRAHEGDHWQHMTTWDRCVTRGMPGGMIPAGYNNAYQIIQTPGYVLIAHEMIHEAHIIPLNAPHSAARQINGDSVGHWEGNTLVVDTVNFDGRGQIATSAASGRIRGVRHSPELHVVERYTRTSENTIQYEARIEDPVMYTSPWKISVPLMRDDSYTIYEYACHEGNSATQKILQAGRAAESGR